MITLDFDTVLDDVLKGFSRSSGDVQKAIKRAVRKTVRGVQRQALRVMSNESGVTQKNIKKYHRITTVVNGMEGVVWVGLNPLPLHLSGRVTWRQKSSGARVNGKVYTGAFYRKVYSGEAKVWIRSSRNRQEGHATYHPIKPYREFSGDVSRGRFPVELLGVPLETARSPIEEKVQSWALPFFKKRLIEELNFAINHERT